jgi:hypothetical protein
LAAIQISTKSKVWSIILIIVGAYIFISELLSLIGFEYNVYSGYQSPFSYMLAIIFGQFGWGVHFGTTLIIIGAYPYIKKEKTSEVIEGEVELQEVENTERKNPNDLTVIEWFGTLILVAIPLVNLILLLVWGFGANNPRKNFSKAILLYILVASVISVFVVLLSV